MCKSTFFAHFPLSDLRFFETFLEGFVDRVIYRDYIVNQRLIIYCNLATYFTIVESWEAGKRVTSHRDIC